MRAGHAYACMRAHVDACTCACSLAGLAIMAKLTPSDIKVLLPELHSICDKWYNIGLQLDLSVDYLEELDSKLFTHKVHVSTCLKRVLVRWLKSNQPTWQALIKVLNSDLVKEKHIADVLRKKYNAISLGKDFLCDSVSLTCLPHIIKFY